MSLRLLSIRRASKNSLRLFPAQCLMMPDIIRFSDTLVTQQW
jgi:hypothetical protein